MGHLVKMPKLSMQMERGIVLEWCVDESDSVKEGDIVAEIESEKAVGDVSAQEDGILRRQLVPKGDQVEPGIPIGIIALANEDIADLENEAQAAGIDLGDMESTDDASEEAVSDDLTSEARNRQTAPDADSSPERVKFTPRARKLAREIKVDGDHIEGTGPKGAITSDDIERAVASDGTAGADTSTVQTGVSVDPEAIDGDPVGRPGTPGRNRASPRARRLADQTGVDVSRIEGSGQKGTVIATDVKRAASRTTQQGTKTLTVAEERPMNGMRQTIADRLSKSYHEALHVTEHREVNVEALLDATEVADQSLDVDVSLVDLVLAAVSETLTEHPSFNARFENDVHRVYEEQNVGMAVDIDAGLITPVVQDISEAPLADITARRREMTDLALDNEYTMDDLSDGTFTVTNLGVFGVDSFTPIINPPEVAILALNSVRERAVRGTNGQVEFRRFMTLSLSFDHRVVDGADAARFLATLTDHVENAHELLLKRGQ